MVLSRFRGRWFGPGKPTSAGLTQAQTPAATSPAQPATTVASLVQPAATPAAPAVNPLEDKFGQWVAQHSSFLKGSTVVEGSGLSTMKIGNGWPYAWLEPHSPAATTLTQIATRKPAGLKITTHTLLSHYLLATQHLRPVHPLGLANSSYLVGSAAVKLNLTFYQDRLHTPELAERLMICLELAQHRYAYPTG